MPYAPSPYEVAQPSSGALSKALDTRVVLMLAVALALVVVLHSLKVAGIEIDREREIC